MKASSRAQLTVNGRIGSCGTATDARRDEWEAATALHDCTTWPMVSECSSYQAWCRGVRSHRNVKIEMSKLKFYEEKLDSANSFLTHLAERRDMQQLAGMRRCSRASGSQSSTYQCVEDTFPCLSGFG